MERERGNEREEIEEDDDNIDEEPAEEEISQKSVSDILREDRDFSISELIDLLNRPKDLPKTKVVKKPKVIEKSKIPSPEDLVLTFKEKEVVTELAFLSGCLWNGYRGFKYDEILKYYYQGIKLSKIY